MASHRHGSWVQVFLRNNGLHDGAMETQGMRHAMMSSTSKSGSMNFQLHEARARFRLEATSWRNLNYRGL